KGHRLIGVSALRFQKFKDPPLWLTVPIVDKGHTLRVTFRRDAFADDHFKPAFLAVGLLATVDIATVQSDRERGSRVRQRWIFIVLWGNKKKPFFSQFLFHALSNLVDVASEHGGTHRVLQRQDICQ